MHLADTFIQSDLKCIQAIHFFLFVSLCVPWELNPQPFALLTQCSTTEPQEHRCWESLLISSCVWLLRGNSVMSTSLYVCKLRQRWWKDCTTVWEQATDSVFDMAGLQTHIFLQRQTFKTCFVLSQYMFQGRLFGMKLYIFSSFLLLFMSQLRRVKGLDRVAKST